MQILEKISQALVSICCDKKGTHTVQKFIDLANLEQEIKYFQRVLSGHVADLSLVSALRLIILSNNGLYFLQDSQGTHVIQNILKCFEESQRQWVLDEVNEKFIELAMNNSGLCVIKLIITKTAKLQNRALLMKKLVANAIELAQNPYGNYAIQQAFDFWDADLC